MTSATPSGVMTAILPCNNLDVSERFYNRLGFARPDTERPASREAEIPSLDRCGGRLARAGQKPIRSLSLPRGRGCSGSRIRR